MTVWRSTNVDWSAGDGLKVLQLFQRAYPDPLKLQASAMRAGVAPADLTDASHERTLSKAAEQSRLLAMAAVLLHDTSRAVFHIRLREVLGDELPAAQAEWYIMYGTPTDQQEGEQLLNPQVVDALLQHDGFESFNAPHAASGSADAHARVHDEARNRVAMIRLNGHPVATGFLVGPDLLLTAAHAIGLRPWPPTSVSGLVAVFDYRSGAASAGQAGMPIQVADFLEGSLPADDEGIAGAPQPAIPSDRLDFALLRLERQIGVGQGLGGVSRGWYCLDATNYSFANATLLLLWGHPSGMELQHTYTVGTITSNPNGPRVRYTTNTERGSSGCPVVEPSGRLVAMHHFSV